MVNTNNRSYIEGQPNVNDVLYGSGKGSYQHPGNQVFHRLVKAKLQDYYEVKTHRSKQDIAQKVITDIKSKDPPGRFLRFNKENQKWFEVAEEESLAKTQQQFRNRISMDRKALLKTDGGGGPKENKQRGFRPEHLNFNTQAIKNMSNASRVVLDLEIIELLGDIFLEIQDLNVKYAGALNSNSFGSLVMNLPGRGQLKIFQAASTLVYATQADKATGIGLGAGIGAGIGIGATNKRQRQGFVAASANARPTGPTPFVPTAAAPFAAQAPHAGIRPPMAMQGTRNNNEWAHHHHPPAGVAGGGINTPIMPARSSVPALAVGQTPMPNNLSTATTATAPTATGPNQNTGSEDSANTVPMEVDTTAQAKNEEEKGFDAVNEDNRIIRNESIIPKQNENQNQNEASTSPRDKDDSNKEKDSNEKEETAPVKSTPIDVQNVVMGTLVALFVEAMRLQLEHPKWDPLEHSQSIYEMCNQGKYASTLFEVASTFSSFRSTNGSPPSAGKKEVSDKEGQQSKPNATNGGASLGLSALGTLADVASESDFGNEVQVANLKPLGGWNRLFVGSILDDLPHGVGCLTHCRTMENDSNGESGDGKEDAQVKRFLYGCWSKGYLMGKGWETYANGSKYSGEFQQGIAKGAGRMIYSNGLVREGNFESWDPNLK